MPKTYGQILYESQGGTDWASQTEAVRALFETRAKDLILEFERRVMKEALRGYKLVTGKRIKEGQLPISAVGLAFGILVKELRGLI